MTFFIFTGVNIFKITLLEIIFNDLEKNIKIGHHQASFFILTRLLSESKIIKQRISIVSYFLTFQKILIFVDCLKIELTFRKIYTDNTDFRFTLSILKQRANIYSFRLQEEGKGENWDQKTEARLIKTIRRN